MKQHIISPEANQDLEEINYYFDGKQTRVFGV
jgi:hypothetical protein